MYIILCTGSSANAVLQWQASCCRAGDADQREVPAHQVHQQQTGQEIYNALDRMRQRSADASHAAGVKAKEGVKYYIIEEGKGAHIR